LARECFLLFISSNIIVCKFFYRKSFADRRSVVFNPELCHTVKSVEGQGEPAGGRTQARNYLYVLYVFALPSLTNIPGRNTGEASQGVSLMPLAKIKMCSYKFLSIRCIEHSS